MADDVILLPSPLPQVLAGSVVPPHTMLKAPLVQLVQDIEFGGGGRIYGNTEIKGTPAAPVKARVLLLRQRDKLVARMTWSDPITGAFEFASIDARQEWLTLAEDAAGNFRPVAANRLVPEVAP